MKNKILTKTLMLFSIITMITGTSALAQHENCPHAYKAVQDSGGKGMCQHIPNLTEEQQVKITALRTEHLKAVIPLKNDLDIKQAELKKLETSDKPDVNLINKKIEEIGNLNTELEKSKSKHRQDVRALLTEEQKVQFDAHVSKCSHHNTGGGKNCMKNK